MRYFLCEPGEGIGGGIFQGVCLGLVFCWRGDRFSDLPKDEIKYFDTAEEAEECKSELLKAAEESDSSSLRILRAITTVPIESEQELEAIAEEWRLKEIE